MKILRQEEEYTPGYGAGEGVTRKIVYTCPCGKGIITKIKDDIPGFKDTEFNINCEECQKKYTIDDISKIY